ncbi:MAG: exo-alpha-sialidase [Bacteroidales bacterium]|nr:exo-alpha-sialidase [Bacteroidales bacterium]
MNRLSAILFSVAILAGCCAGRGFAGLDKGDVRLSWDESSYTEFTSTEVVDAPYTVEENLYYPRIKGISDGSLLFSFENHHYGWEIYLKKSTDGGRTWGPAKLLRHSHSAVSTVGNDLKVFVNPDFYQLSSGRILMAWQWRYKSGYSDLPNTNENCGIELTYSDDMGESWSEPREVYRGRCWEPAFLELPSGEIQLYLTDSQEIKDGGSYACTSIIRSFDGGNTWQGKDMALWTDTEPISRTIWNGRGMDGMPTAVLLDGGKGIVVPLETWSGRDVYDISPITVRTSMEENWHVDGASIRENGGPAYPRKKQVNKDLKAFGPYSCKLPGGEMVILTNGRYRNDHGVFALVGDVCGDNFGLVTTAFPVSGAYWGSIDCLDEYNLIATATVRYHDPANGGERGKVLVRKAWVNRSRSIGRADLEIQPLDSFVPDGLWMLGGERGSKAYVDFGYTADAFQLGGYIFDESVVTFSPENSDAVQILLARKGKGTWKVTVNANGDYTLYREDGFSWEPVAWEYGKADVVRSELGYSAKLDLPWETIGGKPGRGEQLRIHMCHIMKTGPKLKSSIKLEDMEGESRDYPGEWLSVKLK